MSNELLNSGYYAGLIVQSEVRPLFDIAGKAYIRLHFDTQRSGKQLVSYNLVPWYPIRYRYELMLLGLDDSFLDTYVFADLDPDQIQKPTNLDLVKEEILGKRVPIFIRRTKHFSRRLQQEVEVNLVSLAQTS